MFKNLNAKFLGISGTQSEIIELALTYGFDSIDFDVVDFANRAKLRGMDYARRLFDSAKLRVGTYAFPFAWDSDEAVFRKDMERLPEYAEAAAALGCTRCLATVEPATNDRPYHENFEFHRTRFAEICEVLQKTNTWLGIGFRASADLRQGKSFQFIHEHDALGLLLNMVGTPNIGMILDIWDYVAAGGEIENMRSIPVNQIVAVQIADMSTDVATADLTEVNRLLPATTDKLEIGQALKILSEGGYEGPVTIKPCKTAADTRRRDPVAKAAAVAMHLTWQAAELPPTQVNSVLMAAKDLEAKKAKQAEEAVAEETAEAGETPAEDASAAPATTSN